ncbi:MAG: alpha/beta fold hydrolase [Acidobacteriota bacterium]|nr:alpha/beta fold hydrolase [Acidobacteriota bacterium]
MNSWSIFLLALMCFPVAVRADEPRIALPRQVYWGASVSVTDKDSGAVVRRVTPGSPAEQAGLKPNDVILQIKGRKPTDRQTYEALLKSTRAGDAVDLQVSRAGKVIGVRLTPVPLPKEVFKNVEVIHDSVVTEHGHRVRTIMTRPANAQGRLPAMLLVPWLSCNSVEWPLGPSFGVAKVLHGLAEKSGFVLMRVERPGVGDSEGPPCADNDLRTDVAAYRAALQALKKSDFVDADNIFLFGSSLGGALAPIIARDEPVRGLIVSGGFTKTWYEHMLEIERTRLALLGRTPAEINEAMRGYSEFYSMYLNWKLTPAEVIRQRPHLGKLWDDEPERQYGRPAAFYHQVQELNVEAAWEQISAPVLVIYGEYDWIMSRDDHELVVQIVNQRHPATARLVIAPKTSHSLDVYESMEKAFKEEGSKFDDGLVTLMIDWLKEYRNTEN